MSLPIKQVKQVGTSGPKPEQYEHRDLTHERVLTLLQLTPSPLGFTGGVPTPHPATRWDEAGLPQRNGTCKRRKQELRRMTSRMVPKATMTEADPGEQVWSNLSAASTTTQVDAGRGSSAGYSSEQGACED